MFKPKLEELNKAHSGGIFKKVILAREGLLKIQNEMLVNPFNLLMITLFFLIN